MLRNIYWESFGKIQWWDSNHIVIFFIDSLVNDFFWFIAVLTDRVTQSLELLSQTIANRVFGRFPRLSEQVMEHNARLQ